MAPKILFDKMTHMVLLLRHSDQIIRVRTSSTRECNGQFAQDENLSPSGFAAGRRPLRNLQASSIPLSSGGTNDPGASGSSGSENRFYSEAPALLDPASSPAGRTEASYDQPLGGTSFAALFKLRAKSWVTPEPNAKSVVKTNMSMIVLRPKRCLKSITGSCPRWKSLRARRVRD